MHGHTVHTRNIWQKVFQDDKDPPITATGKTFLNNNIHRLKPFETADTSRLNNEYLDSNSPQKKYSTLLNH